MVGFYGTIKIELTLFIAKSFNYSLQQFTYRYVYSANSTLWKQIDCSLCDVTNKKYQNFLL